MDISTVTNKGQVTIPRGVGRRLGIRKGSKVELTVVVDHVESHFVSASAEVKEGGFGMLKSKRPAASADFDPASLLTKERQKPKSDWTPISSAAITSKTEPTPKRSSNTRQPAASSKPAGS